MNAMRRQAGFTLIEMVITIVVIGIIAGISAMLILQAMRGYSDQDVRADLTNQGRLAIERMAREIRETRQASDIAGPLSNPSNSIQFVKLDGTTVTFALSGGTTLNRTDASGTVPLAQTDSMTLAINHYDSTGALTTTPASVRVIQIDLSVTRGTETQPLRIRVYPRSFS